MYPVCYKFAYVASALVHIFQKEREAIATRHVPCLVENIQGYRRNSLSSYEIRLSQRGLFLRFDLFKLRVRL